MKKFEERMHKDSCWNNAKDEDYVFVLVQKDLQTPDTIRYWAVKRVEKGLNKPDDPQILSALEEADAIEREQGLRGNEVQPPH